MFVLGTILFCLGLFALLIAVSIIRLARLHRAEFREEEVLGRVAPLFEKKPVQLVRRRHRPEHRPKAAAARRHFAA